jgi:peroxiredoxin family protein
MANRRPPPVPSEPASLGILLVAGDHGRAHYAFVLAVGAAALGRKVTLFATNRGCHALLADWHGLEDAARDATVQTQGVAGLDELRDMAAELDVTMIVCEAGLRGELLADRPLLRGVTVGGVASFLAAVGSGQMLSL